MYMLRSEVCMHICTCCKNALSGVHTYVLYICSTCSGNGFVVFKESRFVGSCVHVGE